MMITHKSTCRIAFLYMILVVGFSGLLSSQKRVQGDLQAPEKQVAPAMNNLRMYLPPGNVFVYEYHDSTRVDRLYSDSSRLDYTRDIVYYLQMKTLKDPSDGVTEVLVNIDSLVYRFKSGDASISYDNRSRMELKFPDLIAATVPVNREFTMKLSPYWEVVSCEGPMLEWLSDYIEKYGEGQLDSMRKFIWLNGITAPALAQFADLQKGVLPNTKVHRDSSWTKPYILKVDGIDCRDDSATSHIASYSHNQYDIETVSKHLKVLPGRQRLYRIESMLDILGGEGIGRHSLMLTRKGVVTESRSDFVTVMKAQIRNEIFTQKVESTYTWKLTGQLAY